jgi:hypothetical protein
MVLPALLYVTFMPHGSDIRGPGISAALAETLGAQVGPWLAVVIAFLGAWLLFKSQLDIVDSMTRSITDILWSGSRRVREWRGGDVRSVYYFVLAVIVVWGSLRSDSRSQSSFCRSARTSLASYSRSRHSTCSTSIPTCSRRSCVRRYGGASRSYARLCSTAFSSRCPRALCSERAPESALQPATFGPQTCPLADASEFLGAELEAYRCDILFQVRYSGGRRYRQHHGRFGRQPRDGRLEHADTTLLSSRLAIGKQSRASARHDSRSSRKALPRSRDLVDEIDHRPQKHAEDEGRSD